MTATRPQKQPGRGIGWTLLLVLAVSVCIAISLAVQLSPERASPEPTPCGGLFSECCREWDDDWGPCIEDCSDFTASPADQERSGDQGLFDAEENFADRRRTANC